MAVTLEKATEYTPPAGTKVCEILTRYGSALIVYGTRDETLQKIVDAQDGFVEFACASSMGLNGGPATYMVRADEVMLIGAERSFIEEETMDEAMSEAMAGFSLAAKPKGRLN